MALYEQRLGNSGKENLSFNRKDPVAEANSQKGSLPRPGGGQEKERQVEGNGAKYTCERTSLKLFTI